MATPEDVARLAALARIKVPEDRLPALAAEFESILKYIGQLDELAIDRSKPVAPAVHNVFREDGNSHPEGKWTEELAAQFPERQGDALSVKQIISYD